MKKHLLKVVPLAALPLLANSCMTTYDAYGRPVQSVDPAAAAVGVAAAAVIGYAVANDNRNDRHHYRGHAYHEPYHGGGYSCY